jgi:hypothetical protein
MDMHGKMHIFDSIRTRTHLKNVFWPNIFVEASILNQNPIFEILNIEQERS